ncbi:acriflavine sensitivity control acr-2 [Fusarium globosum]|uniref:Acriflavine sensitivity control acr-2 n=1 Tax=Fusarium globosum TaxID=78864 RepID=A0A8H6D149_9HYPO|nr:acriflavine sensitivity control acr-2 [Fusarium globosum]
MSALCILTATMLRLSLSSTQDPQACRIWWSQVYKTSQGAVEITYDTKALRYLKHELRVQPEINTDAVIAAVLLFVNLDVVEFGGRGWKYHLRGAEELIRIRKGLVVDDSEKWLQYFDTACTTFSILGSTLVPSHSLRVAPMPLDTGLLDTLRRSEQQTWIGCPADLLSLLHVMNTLRTVSDHSSHADETVTSILDGLDNFSPRSWAHDFPDPQYYESRYHLAHAYKAAVSVYAVQIIAELSSTPSSFFSDAFWLIELGISHMSQIQASDFHIKSLVWPAFVLGAGAQELQTREDVRNIMHNIWVSSCCYNVRTALWMLERIWGWGQDGNEGRKQSWLRFIWEQGESWLFL